MRIVKQRKRQVNKTMQAEAAAMLAIADDLFTRSRSLDTAVGDIVSEGLARIVHSAYDTQACAQCVSDTDFVAYIETHTYQWFRDKGFVEWFCAGASTLFMAQPRSFYRYHVTKEKSGKATRIKREAVA